MTYFCCDFLLPGWPKERTGYIKAGSQEEAERKAYEYVKWHLMGSQVSFDKPSLGRHDGKESS